MFEFKINKAIEAVLLFAEMEHEKNDTDVDFIKINKYCYFSEQLHLKKYLKPIFGDIYYALPEGPVPSALYDIMKWMRGDRNEFMKKALKAFSLEKNVPFQVCSNHHIKPLRTPDTKKFSESEIEVMNTVFDKYHIYKPFELSRLSHREKAWRNAQNKFVNEMHYKDIIGNSEAWNYIEKKKGRTNFSVPLFDISPDLNAESLSVLFDKYLSQGTVGRKSVVFPSTGKSGMKYFAVLNLLITL